MALSFVVLLAAGLTSCLKNRDVEKNEEERIQNFLDIKEIDTEPTESGLYYIEFIEGSGAQAFSGDTVEVYYEGSFLDGRVFDRNTSGEPLRFALGAGQVIEGWEEGLTYMKEGGEAMLVIPSSLAYGPSGYYSIPGYTPLVYTIALEKVTPGSAD